MKTIKEPKYNVKPTENHKSVVKLMSEKVRNKEKVVMKDILAESGYAVSVQNSPQRVTESAGFQYLLAQIDDDIILGRLFSILVDDDKRASLQSADMLLKLKDRYPQNKLRAMKYQDELGSISVVEKT
jgi:hypothetical protein|tara:strand:- start:54 stop:437 length:384 start_codon:yes stop_codon:yes gene_type:complete